MSEGELVLVKICHKCNLEKSINDFSKDRKSKNGIRNICKKCSTNYLHEWQDKNRDKYRALLRENYQVHQPERMKYQRNYRQDRKKMIAHDFRKHNKNLLPLASNCELCGDIGKLERHHPDYDFPEIYVTVCGKCQWWIHHG